MNNVIGSLHWNACENCVHDLSDDGGCVMGEPELEIIDGDDVGCLYYEHGEPKTREERELGEEEAAKKARFEELDKDQLRVFGKVAP